MSRCDSLRLSRQRPEASSRRLDDSQMASESISMDGDNLSNAVGSGPVRQSLQLEYDHAMYTEPVANYQFAKVSVRRKEEAAFHFGRPENLAIRNPRKFSGNQSHIEAFGPKAIEHGARDVFVRDEAHRSIDRQNRLVLHVVSCKCQRCPKVFLG
jgi:hypothetical protein